MGLKTENFGWTSGGGGGGGFPIHGGGTLNYIAKFTPDGTHIGNSILFDDGTNVGLATITPTARLQLPAGTTVANTAPLKLTSGALNTIAEVGAIEFLTDKYYGTITTGAQRVEITLNNIALTSTRVPFVTTNGRLTDISAFTFVTTNSVLTLGTGANKITIQGGSGAATSAMWMGVVPTPTNYSIAGGAGTTNINADSGMLISFFDAAVNAIADFALVDIKIYTKTAFTNFGTPLTPTALVHIDAGTAVANTAPLKLTAGVNLTVPEEGAIEFDGTNLFYTTNTLTRLTIATTTTNVSDNQTITGTTMTLANTPLFIYAVFKNGQQLNLTADYTIVGAVITFINPLVADVITVVYQY